MKKHVPLLLSLLGIMGMLAWSTAARAQCFSEKVLLDLPIVSGVTDDLSAYSQSVSVNGTEAYVAGHDNAANGALSVTGPSDYAVVPANPSLLELTGGFTMAAWVYPTSISNFNTFIGKVNGSHRNIVFRFLSDGRVQVHFTFSSSIIAVTTDNPIVTATNQWYHLAATWDGAGTMRIFVNGNLAKEQMLAQWPVFQTSGDLLIGSLNGGGEKLTGYIDDVQIRSYPVEPESVPCLMNSTVSIEDNLVLSLPLDGDGTDASTYANDGVVNGASADSDRFMNASSSMNFTSNGYITVNNQPQYSSLTSAFSISAWVNSSNVSGNNVIVSKVGAGRDIVLGVNDGKLVAHYFVGGYVWVVPAAVTVVANEWIHVACTWDGTAMRLYQNGEEVYSLEPSTLPSFTSNNWVVGSLSTGNERFKGRVDEVKVWSRTLAPCELVADMQPYLDLITEDNLVLCPGQNQLVTANYEMCSYLWTNDNSMVNIFNIEAGTLGVGEHQVVLEAYDFYDNLYTDTVNVSVSLCTGIEETNESNPMKLFPNPATDVVIVSAADLSQIQLLDVSGRLLQTTTVVGTDKTVLDISKVPSGIYFIEGVQNDGTIYTERLMKH